MTFTETEAEFRQLKTQYDAGDLSETDFKARLEELMVQDEQGRWWMIGYETGQWYVHDGEKWVRAEPPASQSQPTATTAPPDKPIIARAGSQESVPRPPARPGRSWLRIGGGIAAAVVIIGVIVQLASRVQPTTTPVPTQAPTQSPAP